MQNIEAIDLLECGLEGISEWNRLRQQGKQSAVTLSIYRPLYLDGNEPLDWHGIDLGGCDLQGSEIELTDLTNAHLFLSNLSECNLSGAKFIGAHMVEADISNSNISETRFDIADLRYANLQNVSGNANFYRAQMSGANLSRATLGNSNFRFCDLRGAHLLGADLRYSDMEGCDLSGANLEGANLANARLAGANLSNANFQNANLSNAMLEEARLIDTNLLDTNLTGASVYGISAWDLSTNLRTLQHDLNISRNGESSITVDDLEVAQFMYLLMNNAKLRDVIDNITSKVVLILGRFTEERKLVLDAIREKMRDESFAYIPIVFDFGKPASRSTTETVATLAGMARFIIADLTDAKSVLQELMSIVPNNPSLPIQPIILSSQQEPGMLDFFQRYPWFLPVHRYLDTPNLLLQLDDVLKAASTKSEQLRNQETG